jgi:flagellar basal-body rod protein FlgB
VSGLFDKTTDALNSSADLRLLRNSVVSANIANAETPGYKAQKVDFEEALSAAIDREGNIKANVDHPDHFAVGGGSISRLQADVYDNPDVNTTNDKNTVDLEKEMSSLAENTILYKAAIQMINKKLASLRYAVTEGGK